MKRHAAVIVAALVAFLTRGALAQISFTGPAYVQKFDTLQSAPNNTAGVAWTDNVTVPGWYSNRGTYGVTDGTMGGAAADFNDTGIAANAGLFSWGAAGAADRALGFRAGTGGGGDANGFFGVRLVNNTAQTITAFSVMFTGEQWFKSTSAAPHTLGVEYQLGAASIMSGAWTQAGTTFTSPIIAGTTPAALNGNDPANRRGVAARVTGVAWAPGSELWIRFSDGDETGDEQGLGIDDFVFTPGAESGLFLDGVGGYVTAGAAPSLGLQVFTVECWFFRTGAGSTTFTGVGGVEAVPLVAKGRGEADGSNVDCAYFLGIDPAGRLVADFEAYPAGGIAAGQNYPARSTAVLPFNQWTHVAASYDGAATDGQKWKLYINGARATNGEPDPPAGAIPRYDSIQHFGVGSALNSAGAASGFFQGIIDEVRVWNVARSGGDVLAGMSQEISAGAGLVARFGFAEGIGGTTANAVPGNPGGTLIGSPSWLHGRSFPQNAPPVVSITAPIDGYSGIAPTTVNLVAAASDSDGTVAKVGFFSGAAKIGEDTTPPFELAWARSNEQTGSLTITAVATDDSGATTTSAPIGVSIAQNPNLPPVIAVTSPPAEASGLGASVNLEVGVADPENGALTVKFFGRVAPPAPGPDFTLIAIPDTQYYTAGYPWLAQTVSVEQLIGMFGLQTQWIVEQRAARRIAFVSHMGDLVDNQDWQPAEWYRASAAMSNVENPATTSLGHGIPWGVAPGNHDIGTNGQTFYFNQYFGPERWAGRPYYGGHYGALNTNNYELFSASGLDFIVLHLIYDTTPDQGVLDWAESVLQAFPNRRGIVTSHYILDVGNPATFSPQGQAIYDSLKDSPNLFLMLCGHWNGEGLRSDVFQGRTVHSVLQDYQWTSNGGNAFLRIFTFSPANNTIRVESWSPFLNRAVNASDNIPGFNAAPFALPYDMQTATGGWIELGTVDVPAGGTAANFNFTGLEPGKTYEWYASAGDGINTAGTTPRRFSTTGNSAPAVALTFPANGSALNAGTPVTLTGAASDSDGSIARVEFFAGGARLGEDTTAPFSLAWTPAPGAYALTAVATDDRGADSVSGIVNVLVSNPANAPPTVAITAPADGASLGAPATVLIDATAGDPDGAVVKVEFFSGATKLGEDNTPPYRFTWPEVPAGIHTITAVAIDNGFGTTASAPVAITVVEAVGTLPYMESFDSMGVAGTALPIGWSVKNASGGGPGTWTDATGIAPGIVAAMTGAAGPFVATDAPAGTNNDGFNAAVPGDTNNRVLATSPGPGAGVALQLALRNNGASPVTALRIGYDIRRFTAADAPNELPGYRLFYSVNGGVTWAAVSELNPLLAGGEFPAPNTPGVTTVPAATIPLADQWAAGAVLLLRWVDDNASQSSPDQIIGLDNVHVTLPPGQLPAVTLTSPAQGSGHLAGNTINLAATASDADGAITRVEFFVDGGKVGEDSSPPYEFAWTGFAAANHTVVARATDNDGNTAWSAPVNVIYPLPPFTLWKIARFGAQIGDSAMAGDLANPAGDGIPNLVKYALGLDPFFQGSDGLPELSVSGGVASLNYTRLKSAPDIACEVMWSLDLANWSMDGVSEEIVPGSETATTWRIRARLPAAAGDRIFACLRVSRIATGTNAELSSLQTSVGTLAPAFTPAVLAYSVNVDNGVSSFALTPALQDPLATAMVTGPPSLAVGANTFTIRITAEDGVTNRNYTVVVNRAPPPGPPFAGSLVLHLETTQGVATSGGNVTAWNDQSVRQNDLSAVGSPKFGLAQTPSGRPAISFNGNGDKLEKVGAPVGLPAGNANRTMFVVVKYNSSTAWAGVAYGTGAWNQAFGLYIKHPTGELGLHGWGGPNDLISATPGIGAGWLVQSGILSAGTATLFKNGVQIGQFQHTFNTVLSRLLIGQEMANLGYVGMDLSAVLLYDRALTPAERASVDDYLRIKYLQPPGP